MTCPFCEKNIDKKSIVKKGKTVIVFLSDPRLVKGHLLVVPRRHVEKLSELTKAEQEELFRTVIEYQEKILSLFASGCDIRQNYRPFQKQNGLKVHHLHFQYM